MIDRDFEDSLLAANGDREANVIPFDATRRRNLITTTARLPLQPKADDDQRTVAAVVTVTRFIGQEKIHAQVAVFADEIARGDIRDTDPNVTPELSELLADGAVEANSFLDRLTATMAARPFEEFSA
jgi:hypothetical protein